MKTFNALALAAALAAPAVQAGVAPPQFISVNNNNDSGEGSLRWAVDLANQLPDENLIEFTVPTGVVQLESPIVVEGPVYIRGRGARQTVVLSAAGESIFRFEGTPDAPFEATLRDLVLEGVRDDNPTDAYNSVIVSNEVVLGLEVVEVSNGGSSAGGGILLEGGSLEMRDCVLSANYGGNGGALYASNTDLLISRTRFEDNYAEVNGGAVVAVTSGVVTIEDTIMDRNEAGFTGGAMYAGPVQLRVSRTLVSDNVVQGNGAGFWLSGRTDVGQPPMIIENTTFTNNRAEAEGGYAGALTVFAGRVILRNSTVASNRGGNGLPSNVESGAGIYVRSGIAELTIQSTILADNAFVRDVLVPDEIGREVGLNEPNFIAVSNSLIQAVPDAGTLNGVQFANILGQDPRLDLLKDNGGFTETRAFLDGSPVLDAGANPGNLAYDQRGEGFPRAIGTPDIGAYEKGGLTALLSDSFE